MKKIILVIIVMLINTGFISCTNLNGRENVSYNDELVYEDIVNEIIRFHVIANSNSEEDQNLKLKVRDKVIEFVSYNLKDCTSIDESREFIIDNKSKIEEIAKEVVKENGYSYDVTSALSRENFPDKVYGDVIFPQGEYEAYRILIGEAKGENWWCVMFPPLCFVDGTKEVVDSNKIINSLESNKDEDSNKNKVKFKFKIFEILFKNKA
ncbi:stage II sporulation protein R [Clostridium sp. Sa3CUN1]|uniref:Stage II sporulation protein R n=1 Tax=Clostridium gallinarum TaxID=2762246 RepID=A0ABR8Q410_9CLOT|nr:stage II sporulation protein R [Clostridium gallinarum]MBD7915170.1 stage II sporulation protein R [Clostridium gallinarum]